MKQVCTCNLQDYFLGLYMKNSSNLAAKARKQSVEPSLHYGIQIMAFYYSLVLAFRYGAQLFKEENLSY